MTAGIEVRNLFSTYAGRANAFLQAHNICLSMMAPASNTHQAWLTPQTATFGKIDHLSCSLLHTMFAEVHPNNVETFDVELLVSEVKIKLHFDLN